MRNLYLCYCLLGITCVLALPQKTILDSPLGLKLFRTIYGLIIQIAKDPQDESGRSLREARILNKIQQRIPDNVPFPCNVTGGRSLKVPQSVHELRPGDIDIIAAMGDSLTAGTGLLGSHVFHIIITNRGVSGFGGGQGTWREYLTIPNILKVYNPNLFGYAVGDAQTTDPTSCFNTAEIAARSIDMPYMARVLINRMKNHPRVDINKHWKLISFNIGSNDFCSQICYYPSPWTAIQDHRTNLLQTLRILRDSLPRTLVMLASPPHPRAFVATREGRRNVPLCNILNVVECSCMLSSQFRSHRLEYFNVTDKWYDLEEEIAGYAEFQRDDFSVVHIPMMKNSYLPVTSDGFTDMSYLSPDCFHPSQKTHALYAVATWNALFEPVGKKSTNWSTLVNKFTCPTPERPYIMTAKNSNQQNKIT